MEDRQDTWFKNAREKMVSEQLMARGILEERVISAFLKVPRHEFVDSEACDYAYEDYPLRIGCSQTISQPYMVGLMTQCLSLTGEEKVLEIGTGSGYQTAILAECCREVYTIERHSPLTEGADKSLKKLCYENIHLKTGDGTLGWPDEAPFDRILVTAGAPIVPLPLKEQLSVGGILVIPVGGYSMQELMVMQKIDNKWKEKMVCGCVFVKLIGEEGWPED